ncbi:hypothetical protein D9615_007015 [Tricholomella constricta]|uniref:SGNH hydrolase-type esterase domain-containing protein n=1 Tax=Tricholomella constricta TaxID=117010 RepID=A0A8H5M2Y8_9AGAR|nr:hypothetical protein D9615_007015 [Tricholomella constricta]
MSTAELRPAGIHALQRAGQWQATSSGSLVAYWSGASLKFLYTGRALSILTGPLTERKDRFNGGTPMLACVISGHTKENVTTLYDAGPLQIIQLYTLETESQADNALTIELTLIDWASVFELEAILTISKEDIRSLPSTKGLRILWIGDSISCGYTDGSESMPRGCLDAFPFLARDTLRNEGENLIELDMIAFPGVSLTDQNEVEDDEISSRGMISRFSCASPWSDTIHDGQECQPRLAVVALGTNDDAQDVEPPRFQAALSDLLSKLSSRYPESLTQIIIIHPFSDFNDEPEDMGANSLVSQFPTFVQALSLAAPSIKVSSCSITERLMKRHTMDGLHPNSEGQAILASAWLDALRAIIDI